MQASAKPQTPDTSRAFSRYSGAPTQFDRMLAAAHALALDVLASPAAVPVINAGACTDWLLADCARDHREERPTERRGPIADRRRGPTIPL